MMRVRLDLEALSSVATRSAEREEAFRDQFINELALHHEALADSVGQNFMQVDQRVGRIEELLKAQMAQMQVSQSMQLGTMYGLGRVRSRTPSRGLPMDLDKEQARTDLQAIGVRVTRHVGTICRPGCLCNCHSGNRSNTPGMLDSIVGKLFVGYAGLPLINPKCDTALCQRRQSPSISAEYWFPLGFCWSQIIRFQLGYEPNLGPQMSLSTLRQVPDDAQCVTFALKVMSRVSRPCSTVDWPVHEM